MLPTILYISNIPWDFSWHREQEMMSYYAKKGYKIIFIEPYVRKQNKKKIKYISENIIVLRFKILPFERCNRIINFINKKITKKKLLSIMNQLTIKEYILWLDRIHGFDFDYFSRNAIIYIYDLIDELTAFGRYCDKTMLIELEKKVINNIDLLISSSNTLMNRKLTFASKKVDTLFIPNGIDISRFNKNLKKMSFLDPLKTKYDMILGFIGTISYRSIDIELIKYIANNLKNNCIVLIGPKLIKEDKDEFPNNVYFFDSVEENMIPSVLDYFDICLIPYIVKNKEMDYVFPRKLFEYFAANKPVVSTEMKELFFLDKYVAISKDEKEFLKNINLISKNIYEEGMINRKKIAEKYDWNLLLSKLDKKIRRNK